MVNSSITIKYKGSYMFNIVISTTDLKDTNSNATWSIEFGGIGEKPLGSDVTVTPSSPNASVGHKKTHYVSIYLKLCIFTEPYTVVEQSNQLSLLLSWS